MVSRTQWYFNRLKSMSLPEILHRIAERRLRARGRRIAPSVFAQANVPIGELAFDDAKFVALAELAVNDWRQEVERAKAGNWHFLGRDWPSTPLCDLWHLDPVSGKCWPKQPYCFDINYRHNDAMGDIKYTWEANRLQILPVAAALWRADGRMEDRDFAIAVMNSWLDANPPFQGVNWASGIELALRVANILAAVTLLGADTLDKDLGDRIATSLQTHLFWLTRYPSRFSSANNHLVAELAASYLLGRLMPKLDGAQAAADHGWTGLMDEALRQIHPDGVGAEQSPTYTCFTLEWILLAIAVARQVGDEVPRPVLDRLTNAGTVLRWMMDSGGQVPRIGDDDEGRVILSGAARESDYVALVLSSLAATLGRLDLAPPKDRAHLRQLWIGRSAAVGKAPEGAAIFDEGGYSVLRHTLAGRESMMVMDHGPLGYLSIAAHGHADALALWWHLDDQPVFIDAGTYLYHSGGSERDYFRGTSVHNTLCLDERDQSQISGAFNWARKAKAWRVQMEQTTGGLCIEGAHDGYKRLGVTHRRKLALSVPDGYVISDWLEGRLKEETATTVRISWLLHPDVTARFEGHEVVLCLDERPLARFEIWLGSVGRQMAENASIRPEIQLIERHWSPDFGRKTMSTSLEYTLVASDLSETRLHTMITVM